MKRLPKLDPLKITASLANAIDDLRQLEPLLPERERGVVSNYRIGCEEAHAKVMNIVNELNARREKGGRS